MKIFTIHTSRKITLSIITFILLLAVSPLTGYGDLLDKVVAVVNDDIITLSELDKEADHFVQRVKDSTPEEHIEEAMVQMRAEVLKGIIEKKLIVQQAKEKNLGIAADEFNAAYNQMLASNNMSKEQFVSELEKTGMTEAYHKEMFRSQMLESKLVQYEVRSKIVVTEEQILDYYDKEFVEHLSGDGFYILQMGFIWNNNDGEEGVEAKALAKTTAERVHKLAKSGKDFRELARKFSQLPSAKDGGDIGVFTADEMFPAMREAIVSLPPKGISDIIETPSGFQFFQLLSSKEGNVIQQAPYESVKEKIREQLYNTQMKEEYEKWINELRDQAYIEILK